MKGDYDVPLATDLKSGHTHSWLVIEWLSFDDTTQSYQEITEFRPVVYNTKRVKALRIWCPECNSIQTVPDGLGRTAIPD